MVQLDVTAVNVALQWIGTSLGGGVAGLQWGRERLHGRVCQLHSLSGCGGRPARRKARVFIGVNLPSFSWNTAGRQRMN